jgi:hypothetical protein
MTTEIIAALEQDRLEHQERSEHDRRKAKHGYDPPGLNPKADRDPDRLLWRRTSIRQASQKLWAAA